MSPGNARRGRQPDLAARAERRAQILEAAERCVIRKGFHASTTAEISAEAQISVAGLYQHFPSKDELILALIEKDLEASIGWIARISLEGDFIAGVERAMAEAIEAALQDDSARLKTEIIAEATRSPVVAGMLADADAKMVAAVARVFSDAQARGHADPRLDPQAVARASACLFDGLFARLSFPPAARDPLLAACMSLLRLTMTPPPSN